MQGEAKEAKALLGDLENIKHLLSGLTGSIDTAITDLKAKAPFIVRIKSLSSLPDELLAMILEYALETGTAVRIRRRYTIQTLSLVCQRFRRILKQSPCTWSYIDNNDDMQFVRTCLARSGSVGLSVFFTITGDNNADALQMLATIAPHSARWENLTISFNEGHPYTRTESFCLSERLQNLYLPSLQSLCLLVDPGNVEGDIYHFYESWDMPSLQRLEINKVPRKFVAPAVTSVRYLVPPWGPDPNPDNEQNASSRIQRLRPFLSAFPTLLELDVALSPWDRHGLLQMPSLSLSQLRSLRVEAYNCLPTTAGLFMAKLYAPMLRKLEFITFESNGYDDRILDFFPQDDYPALEDLTCRMIRRAKDPRGPRIAVPFEKLQGLRSLTIDAPNLVHFVPVFEPPSTLRKLKLNSVAREWLSDLRWSFGKDVWKGLEVLEIGCKIPITTMNEIDEAHVDREFY